MAEMQKKFEEDAAAKQAEIKAAMQKLEDEKRAQAEEMERIKSEMSATASAEEVEKRLKAEKE